MTMEIHMAIKSERIVACVPDVTADKSHRPGEKYNLYVTGKRMILEYCRCRVNST